MTNKIEKLSKFLSIIKNRIIQFIQDIYNKITNKSNKNKNDYRPLHESFTSNPYYDSIYDDESIPIKLYSRYSDDSDEENTKDNTLHKTIPDLEDYTNMTGFGDLKGDFGIIREASSEENENIENIE